MRRWRRLLRAWHNRPRLRAGDRKQRALTVSARAARLGRIADSESVGIDELEDALRLLAAENHATLTEILDVVEEYGLAGASGALRGV